LQDRVAGRLGIDALRFHQEVPEKFTPRTTPFPYLAFALAALLSAAAVAYALIH
jgi:hypothetical protein